MDENVYKTLKFENGEKVLQKYGHGRGVFYYVNAHTGRILNIV